VGINFERYYKEIAGLEVQSSSGDELHARCPFHDDKVASLSINIKTGLWNCFGACQVGGNIFQFHAKKFSIPIGKAEKDILIRFGDYLIIPTTVLDLPHKALLINSTQLEFFYKVRGITIETIKKFKLGWADGRLWIPIFDEDDYLVNVRKYKPNTTEAKVISFKTGVGKFRLFPIENLKHDEILLVEGEMDCLLANQLGYHAMTGTGGAGHFDEEAIQLFKNKLVYICYDIDKAGKDGALKVANQLNKVAKIKIVELPITTPANGDFTDYIITHKKSKEDLDNLIKNTTYLVPSVPIDEAFKTQEAIKVSLIEASDKKYQGKKIQMHVVISGKDLAPYFAPIKLSVNCEGGKKACKFCPVAFANGKLLLTFSLADNEILQLIKCPKSQQRQVIKQKLKLSGCDQFDIELLESVNIEEVRVIPEIDHSANNVEYVTRQVFFAGYGVRANTTYLLEGMTLANPLNQYVTQLITTATPTQLSIDKFILSPELYENLKIFQTKDINTFISNLTKDLAYNVTKIYGRGDLILAIDLVYHSVLQFYFNRSLVRKGWSEGLIIGDTRCGKTESICRLIEHYRLGELCTGENVSYAGLVGGLSQAQQRWSINWGKIPLNDRRLIVLDEVSSLPIEAISNLSALRSSGIAEIVKIQTERTTARTRLIWVSNPRSGRKMDTYNYGVLAIQELIGKVEDVARFDFALCISADEVPITEINKKHDEVIKHVYTSELCHNLLLWIWSRQADQVKFTPEAEAHVFQCAIKLGNKYQSSIPLVEHAEQRIKLARLSVAIAGRTFSTPDGINLIIQKEHVQFIYEFLDRVYSKPVMGYDIMAMSDQRKSYSTPEQRKKIEDEFIKFPDATFMTGLLLNETVFQRRAFLEQVGCSPEEGAVLFRWMSQNRLIRHTPEGYVKQPIFTQILKGLKLVDEIDANIDKPKFNI
jgi:5S rRNA maturation endonuclease (ribonuclease M5)